MEFNLAKELIEDDTFVSYGKNHYLML